MSRCIFGVVWVLLAVGCKAPPARVAACDADGPTPSRKRLAVRQVIGDTIVETGQHPLREARVLASLPYDFGIAITQTLLRRRVDLVSLRRPAPIDPCRPTLDPDELEAALRRRERSELKPDWVDLYTTGEEALAALHQVIDGAACRIDILMYLWDNDPLGWEVAHHLAAVAGPDRPVRILIDGGANLLQGLPKEATAVEVNRVVCWLARQPGVQLIRDRNPHIHFDHRKLVVADGRVAWSGGRNFTYPAFFKDRDVSYTVSGPLAEEMQQVFDTAWRTQGGAPAPPLALPPAPPLAEVNALARLVQTRRHDRTLRNAVYLALDRAEHHIYMENPYLADNRVLLKLLQARQRGVDVRVVMTVSDESEAINTANRVTISHLMRGGVRVYLYPGMTHAKTMVVDGVWGYVGTGNFDRLSLRHNNELGLAIGYGPAIRELEERVFEADMRPEWELHEPLPVTPWDHLRAAVASLIL